MSIQFHRYRTVGNSAILKAYTGPSKTGTPGVYEQAYDLGGKFTKITTGLPKGSHANFSPCLIKHKNADLISWRSQPESFVFRHDMKYFYYNNTPTDIWVGQMLKDDTIVSPRKLISKKHRLSYEDPRLFVAPDDNLMCQFVTSTYATKWDATRHKMLQAPKVCTGLVDEFGELTDRFYPNIGNNLTAGKAEKNWCFFSDGEKLRLLYSTRNICIKTPGEDDKVIDSNALKVCTGEHPTFNSTAPIEFEGEWLVFYHWKHMVHQMDRRPYLMYGLSAYTLDKDLTKITRVLKEPLFMGSVNDDLVTWTDILGADISNQPACILPFGGYINDEGELALALGVNDYFMGIFRTPVVNILSLMDSVTS